MYLSLNWLKELVKIPKNMSADEIALKLTMHTVEVDGVEKQGNKFKNVVIGKILKITKHPNADKLSIVQVDVGQEVLSVVCGAGNINVGQYVPVASIGAVLPGGIEIKEVEVRGEKSFGMLCAEDELGLGSDHTGIMILDKKAKTGLSFADYLKYDDIIIEVDNKSITHRPDLWCHYGIAREMSVFLGAKITAKAIEINKATPVLPDSEDIRLNVKVEDNKLCPRYMAVVLEGVEVAESPAYIQQRLIGVGMRPLNNIVDITNYVMLELGQPLHAFDANKIKSSGQAGAEIGIAVRKAYKNENIDTLDAKNRQLEEGMLLITNQDKPIAIAGVMGGETSEIDGETTSIVIESANFDHISIRKTSQKLGLRSEASARYEKALDPNLCEPAMIRCLSLIKETCPNVKIVSRIIDEKNYNLIQEPINIPFDRIEKMIGAKLDRKWVVNTLAKLGFRVEKKEGILSIVVPSWRATGDIRRPEDIIEEIARIYGYDNIEKKMPVIKMQKVELNRTVAAKRRIKYLLSMGCGLSEVCNYSFVGEDQLKKMGLDAAHHIALLNPIASHQSLLRQNLAVNLVGNAVKNQSRFDEIAIFEIGSIFLSTPGNMPVDNESIDYLPFQEERLGILLASDRQPAELISEAKGIVECLAKGLGFEADFMPAEIKSPWEDLFMSGNIFSGGNQIGRISLVDKKIARNLGVKKNTVIVELGLSGVIELYDSSVVKFEEFEKFPSAIRDLAFVLDRKILYNDFKKEIRNFSPIIKKAELFDVYEDIKLGQKNKSLAFRITYQTDKTLTNEEVDSLQDGLVKRLEEKFGAKLRDF